MKKCSKCGEVKGLDDFYGDKRASDGLQSSCKKCQKDYYKCPKVRIRLRIYDAQRRALPKIIKYRKEYGKKRAKTEQFKKQCREYARRSDVKIHRKAYQQKYRIENRERLKKLQQEFYQEHKEEILQYNSDYRARPERRKRMQELKRKRYAIDCVYHLNHNIREAIKKSLKGNKDGRHWETLVGYTLNQLRKHLEKTLPKGKTWQDYLNGTLHLEHIIPISFFIFNSPDDSEFKYCWSLNNLRLLDAKENMRKGAKLIA